MRKLLLFTLIGISSVSSANAQSTTILGKIYDSTEKKGLSNAVVSLLRKSDSTLVSFIRSDKEGHFQLSNVQSGQYIVLVSYPRFADYSDAIDAQQKEVALGTINMTPISVLLKEVIVRSGQAVRIKGDTTEFAADSFKVKEGATVEDLFKKLPGFTVNSKGEITAQGKSVDKVLVDGEEFFGNDPTMATQNISAKAVDKVQVFETKSDQQQLKGISNGNEGKTVNIKLKEDSKKGAFGKGNIGTDFQKLVDAKLLYNKFIGKKKFSVYGTKTNLSTGSLNWEDRQKLGIENDFEYDEIGGYYFSYGSGDEFNDWSLRGLPDAYTAGALFINKWNADKQSVNGSYRFNSLATNNESTTLSQNILPTSVLYNNKYTTSSGLNRQHAINGKYEWKLDSLASLKLTVAGTYKTTGSYNNTFTETLNQTDSLNRNWRVNNNNTIRAQTDNQLLYRQAFNKKGRLLLATLRFGLTNDDNKGTLNSFTQFYKNNMVDSVTTIDQQKLFKGNSTTYGAKITYNEPLSAKWNLVGEYSFNQNNSESYRNSYDKSLSGKYEVFNPSYSNNFELNAQSNSGTTIFKYTGKKLKAAFGGGVSAIKLNMHNLDNQTNTTYNFTNYTPQVQVGYTIKPQYNISFNYRGTTRQPTIDQLQPIRNNNDPLNEFIGNPDLKVGFNHSLSLFYNFYKVLSSTGLWLSMNYDITQNAITNENTVNNVTGKRTYKPVNVDGNHNWSIWSSWRKGGQGNKKWGHGFQLNAYGNTYANFVNAEKNTTNSATYSFSYGIEYNNEEKFSFELRPKVEYNTSVSSLNKAINLNYYTFGGNAETFVMLPGKLELNTNAEVNLRQKLAAFQGNNNVILWNASLAKKVLKDKSGKIILMANDILDQNKGFNRITQSNFISEERYQRISQYFLLKFEWSFNKMPGKN